MAEEKLQREDLPEEAEEKTTVDASAAENEEGPDDDHPHVESDEDEHHDEYASDEQEMPDYQSMGNADLLLAAEKLIKAEPIHKIKDHIELIKSTLLKNFEDERLDKLHAFIEEGGNEIDFEFIQPLRERFKTLYDSYRTKRNAYYKELNESLTANLAIKQDIINKIKDLPNHEGSVSDAYQLFRDLQDRWRNTGPVPRVESADLWRTYHHHVDNFYDYLHLSKELRELDFKKNQEEKEKLCERAEELAKQEVDSETFQELQTLHRQWKQIGPVDREHREPLWERFSEATKTIHDKRHAYYETLRESREERLQEKAAIVLHIERLPIDKIRSHGEWQKAIKEVEGLRKAFKALGRINHPDNDLVWEKYREVNRNFNRAKNNFYKELKAKQNKNLERKRELLARAEELKESDNWSETAKELKRIQADWKKVGYVPKADSDRVWEAFRAACNHFFDRLTQHNKERDKALIGNLDAKKEILSELESFDPGKDVDKALNTLKDFINRWKDSGPVPRDQRDIENQFNNLIDQKFDQMHLEKNESALIRFENKIRLIKASDDEDKMYRERDALKKRMEEIKKELIQLETNINYFSSGSDDNPLLKEARKNIERHKEQIELIREKLSLIRRIDKEEDEDPSPETSSEAGDQEEE